MTYTSRRKYRRLRVDLLWSLLSLSQLECQVEPDRQRTAGPDARVVRASHGHYTLRLQAARIPSTGMFSSFPEIMITDAPLHL